MFEFNSSPFPVLKPRFPTLRSPYSHLVLMDYFLAGKRGVPALWKIGLAKMDEISNRSVG
ncbi:hypothetical protein PEDI_44630 [Persicobacter diffluens]|uniref:Uncharacterized protein n=1 Tax=Persicobacter diffluens TaxID=981 RepID=A0AAN5AP26_9BACT|nr:hypothetical protein PEDI_44630 [Persicobacter diffluens]